jgi:hypothetical protein
MCGENIFGVKIVNAGTCGVKVNILAESAGKIVRDVTRFVVQCARERLEEKSEKIRYLRRKSLHWGARMGETERNLKVAATSRDGADRGRLMIGHIILFSCA